MNTVELGNLIGVRARDVTVNFDMRSALHVSCRSINYLSW